MRIENIVKLILIALIFSIIPDASFGQAGLPSKKRSFKVRQEFVRMNPCPSTDTTVRSCPGYHVDHVIPLACGGSDLISNLQWLPARENLKKGSLGCRKNNPNAIPKKGDASDEKSTL